MGLGTEFTIQYQVLQHLDFMYKDIIKYIIIAIDENENRFLGQGKEIISNISSWIRILHIVRKALILEK